MRDNEYIRARNELIPQAELNAAILAREKTKETGKAYKKTIGADGKPFYFFWGPYFFHREMNRLAKEAGLVSF